MIEAGCARTTMALVRAGMLFARYSDCLLDVVYRRVDLTLPVWKARIERARLEDLSNLGAGKSRGPDREERGQARSVEQFDLVGVPSHLLDPVALVTREQSGFLIQKLLRRQELG